MLGLASFSGMSAAVPIVLSGNHFSVSYDNASAGLYGTGSIVPASNTVFFTPTLFSAQSATAGGSTSTSSSIVLTLTLDSGYAVTGLNYVERGDYLILDGGAVNVAATVQVKNLTHPGTLSLALAPSAPLNLTGFSTHDWALSGSLSLLALGAPQLLEITLDNSLLASTPTAGLGFIEKKFAGFGFVVERSPPPSSVPEPGSLALLIAGMLAALWTARSRKPRKTKFSEVREGRQIR